VTGTELREWRERVGLTQAHLAARLGVSENTVARWERGELRIQHPAMVALALRWLEQERT